MEMEYRIVKKFQTGILLSSQKKALMQLVIILTVSFNDSVVDLEAEVVGQLR